MTDLTEQWKKGELPSGFYYVKNEFGNIFPSDYSENYDYISDIVIKDFFTEVSEIKEVVEPVPSYKEYLALQSDSLAKNEATEIIAELKKNVKDLKAEKSVLLSENRILNEQLKEVCEKYLSLKLTEGSCDDANKILHGHIKQLKELLKECREPLEVLAEKRNACDWYPEDLLAKISQALGGDK